MIKFSFLELASVMSICAWAGISADPASHSLTFTASATGVEQTTPVEFLFVTPDSDRDYEAVFLTDAKASEIAKAFMEANIPVGKPVDARLCSFWPAGRRLTITPDPWLYVEDKELGEKHLPAVYTGGERDAAGAPVADTNMPAAVFSLYGLSQSLILLDDALDQSMVYGRFLAKTTIEKGSKVEFTISWDGSSGTIPYTLHLAPDNIKESLDAMRLAAADGELDVTPSFSSELTVAESITAANALAVLDSRRVRINGFVGGQFFYRAFMPLEKWRDRKERLTQPLEVRLSATKTVFTVVDENWNVEGLDPILTPHDVTFSEALTHKTDTCFVFTSADTKLAQLYELKRTLPKSLLNWYIYVE